jgi:hypothetical protein
MVDYEFKTMEKTEGSNKILELQLYLKKITHPI